MGTRNLTIVVSDGTYKVSQYCQWDGYPSGQGMTIAKFIEKRLSTAEGVAAFKAKLAGLRVLTAEEIHACWKEAGADDSGWATLDVAKKFKEKNAHLNRDFGAQILEYIWTEEKPEVSTPDVSFAGDSLFCEWAYVLDLDAGVLEVFRGFNEKPLEPEARFADLTALGEDGAPPKYYPVRRVKRWTFGEVAVKMAALAKTA